MSSALDAAIAQESARKTARAVAEELIPPEVGRQLPPVVEQRLPAEVAAYIAAHPPRDGKDGAKGIDGTDGEPGLVWKGPWKRRLYKRGDAVERKGSSYITTAPTREEPPGAPWDLLAAKGEDGKSGGVFIGAGSGAPGGGAGSGGSISATDGTVTVDPVTGFEFPPGSLTDEGGGVAGVSISGLPPQWTDGGSGDVTATTDDNTLTPLTVQGQPGSLGIGLLVESGISGVASGNIAQFFDESQSNGLTLAATGEVQQYIDSDHAAAAWTAKSYPGDRIASPEHDIFKLDPFGKTDIWADSDIDTLTLHLVDTGNPGGRFLVCGSDLFQLLASGVPVIGAVAAPDSGDLAASQAAFWFDDTDGAASPMWKGKSADGTVVSGSLGGGSVTPAVDPGDIADPTLATAEDVALKLNALMAAMRTAGSLA